MFNVGRPSSLIPCIAARVTGKDYTAICIESHQDVAIDIEVSDKLDSRNLVFHWKLVVSALLVFYVKTVL